MKLPRDLSGVRLVKALEQIGYKPTRQAGSHVRLTCFAPKEHHLTVPLHDPLKIGTLASILSDVATHHHLTRETLVEKLFGRN